MVRLITVEIIGKEKVNKLLKKVEKLPEKAIKSTITWGKILERDIKRSAIQSRIQPFTGTLYGSGIRWEQGSKSTTGYLFIRKYGVQLDSMGPHGIKVSKARPNLLRWAVQAQNPNIREFAEAINRGKMNKFILGVRPHPFIQKGLNSSIPKLDTIIKQNVRIS